MLALATALVVLFAPQSGWTTGASGQTRSAYGGAIEATAWTAFGIRYRDRATSDPPNRTLAYLGRGDVIVWAVAYTSATREAAIRLSLARARRLPCCEAVRVAGGEWELAGSHRGYSVIVRVYFGSPPGARMRREANEALARLRLPR